MKIAAVEKFTRKIIDGMYKYFDYTIEDFSFIKGISIPWGLSNLQPDGSKRFFIFVSLDYDNIGENFEEELCSKLNYNKENILKVLLVSGDEDIVETQKKINYIRSNIQFDSNFIILDLVSRSIQISDSSVETPAKQIATILDNDMRTKTNSKKAVVTYTLIGINLLMFIISAVLSGSIMDIDVNVLVGLGAKYNPAIAEGQWFRLFSCIFLHGGLMHIAANMYSLYSIGPLVEHLYGKLKFIGLYVVSGIIASLFSYMFSPYVSIGASGAIFGLMGLLFVFAAKERKRLGKDFVINIASTVAVNLYIGFTLPGIDNLAHLGGLISGAILGSFLMLESDWGRKNEKDR
jgi:rhomboid protease GluP